jgi:endonuclease III
MSTGRIIPYRYLKQTAQKLHDDFDSDVPKTVDDLYSLPGVGPKMAFLALQIAWNLLAELLVNTFADQLTSLISEILAYAWMFTSTALETDWVGISPLQRFPKRPGS